jgi:hypothetical protein
VGEYNPMSGKLLANVGGHPTSMYRPTTDLPFQAILSRTELDPATLQVSTRFSSLNEIIAIVIFGLGGQLPVLFGLKVYTQV